MKAFFPEVGFYCWYVFSRAVGFIAAECRIYRVPFTFSMCCSWAALTTRPTHMAPSWQGRCLPNGSGAPVCAGPHASVQRCI